MVSFDILRSFNKDTADAIEQDLSWLEDWMRNDPGDEKLEPVRFWKKQRCFGCFWHEFEDSVWPPKYGEYSVGPRTRSRKCETCKKQNRLCCILINETLLILPKS